MGRFESEIGHLLRQGYAFSLAFGGLTSKPGGFIFLSMDANVAIVVAEAIDDEKA